MLNILIATSNGDHFSEMVDGLEIATTCTVDWAGSVGELKEKASNTSVDILIIDEKVKEIAGIDIARQVVFINPMINIAIVSALAHNAFHEASEGLGVFAQLPPNPGKQDADKLFAAFQKVRVLETMP
jgi:two-component SAPR family response regulator